GVAVLEEQRAKASGDPRFLRLDQRGFANEVHRLAEPYRKTEARFKRVVLWRDVRAPDAVALFQAHRLDRPVACRDKPEACARLPEGVPEEQTVFGRAVQLPAQL